MTRSWTFLADRRFGDCSQDPRNKIQRCVHGSESRSGDACGPKCAWDVPSTVSGSARNSGDNCAGLYSVVYQGEWGGERPLHPNAVRGYGSRLGTRGHRRDQVPVLLKILLCHHRGDFFACASSGSLERHLQSNRLIRWLRPLSVTVYTAIAYWEQVGSFSSRLNFLCLKADARKGRRNYPETERVNEEL